MFNSKLNTVFKDNSTLRPSLSAHCFPFAPCSMLSALCCSLRRRLKMITQNPKLSTQHCARRLCRSLLSAAPLAPCSLLPRPRSMLHALCSLLSFRSILHALCSLLPRPRSMLHAASLAPCCLSCFLLIFCSLLLFCLFSSPCFAQGYYKTMQERLPSLPNLPSGERIYDAGGASPDQPDELDSISRPVDTQGELKTDTNPAVKANKYKIEYNGDTKRIQGRIEKNSGTRREDAKIENGRGTTQEDWEASELPGQIRRLPDTLRPGFQYQPSPLGRIGFDAGVGKANN